MKGLGLKKVFVAFAIALLVVASAGTPALADDTRQALVEIIEVDPAAMVVDFAVVRPVALASVVTGATFFVASLPFSLLGGNTSMAYEKMVKDAAVYTFVRPLGIF